MSSPLSPFQFGQELFPFRPSINSEDDILEVENAQKLSLNPNTTPVGTVVHVTDGFMVSGAAEDGGGLYTDRDLFNDKRLYNLIGHSTGSETFSVFWDGAKWILQLDAAPLYQSTDDTEFPWEATWTVFNDIHTPGPTLTHPAVQTRIAASTAQGGVAVIGGTQDGVYTARGDNGKTYFNLLGQSTATEGFGVVWSADHSRFEIDGDSGVVYYSLSDVATPDLATNWKNASDDTPASITVTSVSVGELYAGLGVTNDGATNGSSYVSQPFNGRQYYMGLNGGGSNNMHWDTDFSVWTDDVGAWTTSRVAFPWQGVDNGGGHTGATFAQNDVANERNWENS